MRHFLTDVAPEREAPLSFVKNCCTTPFPTIRDLGTGEVRTIPRAEVQEFQSGGTVMPDGLTAGMDERQLAHLVQYLMGLGE